MIKQTQKWNDFVVEAYGPTMEAEGFINSEYSHPDDGKQKFSLYREITFQITSDCNLRCSYCYEHHKCHEVMSFETAKKAIDLILDMYDKNDPDSMINHQIRGLCFSFIGGEPLLEPKLIDQIMTYYFREGAHRRCPLIYTTKVSMATNGMNFFEEETMKFIRKYWNILSISISVDGIKELHDLNRKTPEGDGSFDKAYKAFMWLPPIRRQAKMTFAKDSIKYVKDSILFMIKSDAAEVQCNCAFEPEYDYEDARELFHQLKEVADYAIETKCEKYIAMLNRGINLIGRYLDAGEDVNYCGGTGNMLSFDVHGNALPCVRYHEISIGKEKSEKMIIGDVNGLYTKPEQIKVKEYFNNITFTSQSPQKCLDCPISANCGWCSAYNYEATGDVNKRITNICPIHQAEEAAKMYYGNKRYLEIGDLEPVPILIPRDWALNFMTEEEFNELIELNKKAREKKEVEKNGHSKS